MQQLFSEVVSQFQSANQYDKFIKQVVKEYDIKIYRLHLFSLEHASLIYKQLQHKYQNDLIQKLPSGWHQNQRRLYIWFIVCYINLKLLDSVKLVDNQKHWKHISHTFWDKDILFLKYQLHTIMKTRGRTIWKPFQDQLLKATYQKHQKGEWNEIAKDFYFNSKGEFFKSPKQCRERWQNHLNNQVNKGDWTKEQDKILLQQVKQHSTKWARIVPLLKNARTEHMIKNRYKAIMSKEMQGKNSDQKEVISILLRKMKQQSALKDGRSLKAEVQLLKHQKTQIENNNQIEFVQSQQIFESIQQPKRKRGRPKKKDKAELQTNKLKTQQQANLSNGNNLQKIGQFDGCVVLGPQMPYIQHYFLNSQKSDSLFGQSNSFFRSSGPQPIYNSGHYSINNSLQFACDDKSLSALDQFTVKEDRSGKFEKKQFQNSSFQPFNSFTSMRIKPNESYISKFINSRND